MNHAAPADEGALIEGIRERDGDLADEVRAKLLSFVDIARLQDRDVQQLLRGIELGTIALALKGAAARCHRPRSRRTCPNATGRRWPRRPASSAA